MNQNLIIMIQRPRHLILVIISSLPLKCQGIQPEALLKNQHFVAIPSICFRGPCSILDRPPALLFSVLCNAVAGFKKRRFAPKE